MTQINSVGQTSPLSEDDTVELYLDTNGIKRNNSFMSITYVFEYPTFDRAIQGLSSVLLGIQKSVRPEVRLLSGRLWKSP